MIDCSTIQPGDIVEWIKPTVPGESVVTCGKYYTVTRVYEFNEKFIGVWFITDKGVELWAGGDYFDLVKTYAETVTPGVIPEMFD